MARKWQTADGWKGNSGGEKGNKREHELNATEAKDQKNDVEKTPAREKRARKGFK